MTGNQSLSPSGAATFVALTADHATCESAAVLMHSAFLRLRSAQIARQYQALLRQVSAAVRGGRGR